MKNVIGSKAYLKHLRPKKRSFKKLSEILYFYTSFKTIELLVVYQDLFWYNFNNP